MDAVRHPVKCCAHNVYFDSGQRGAVRPARHKDARFGACMASSEFRSVPYWNFPSGSAVILPARSHNDAGRGGIDLFGGRYRRMLSR